MAKGAKSSGILETIHEIFTIAKERGIMHQFTEDEYLNGRIITLADRPLVNFGSCSYLGLEFDSRLINASVDAVKRYGTQYSSSRAYVSLGLYNELEKNISEIFNAPILVSQNTSLGHAATLPVIIQDNDAVIMDHQVHLSVQEAANKLKLRGIPVDLVRHNRLDELEEKVVTLIKTHHHVWYFADGIYSMYGDVAPVKELVQLLNKYEQFHLYFDDAHGFSWTGKHGRGYVLSQTDLHPRMILTGSLAKSFGSSGGIFVFHDSLMRDKVKTYGGPLSYSGPQQPAVIAASIESAKLHLTPEIISHQKQLFDKIEYCNQRLLDYNIPLVANSLSPIFFVALGLVKVGYNMVKRLKENGFLVNLGIFPAVPENCTGIRFTITNHITFQDIDNLASCIAYHLPLALKEENRDMEDIYKVFKNLRNKKADEKPKIHDSKIKIENQPKSESQRFIVIHENSIKNIDKEDWNNILGKNGMFDWDGLTFLEKAFSNNEKIENNWLFHYFIIKDKNKIIAATFFTEALVKDDVFSPHSISEQIELVRKNDPYYLSSKTLTMGSFLTEGSHLYLDRNHPDWKEVVMLLLDEIWKQKESSNCNTLYLRDFNADDIELRDFFMENGLFKIEIPKTYIYDNFNWKTPEEYLNSLSGKRRNRIRKEVLKFSECFEVKIVENATPKTVQHWIELYKNIHDTNFTINLFSLPESLFYEIAKSSSWEIIELWLKSDLDTREERKAVATGIIYKSDSNYCPVIIGMDYNYVKEYHVYRQMLYQAIMRAKELKKEKIYFGLTAGEEKEKFGAKAVNQVAFYQLKDDYNMALIGLIPHQQKKPIVHKFLNK